LLLHHFAVGVKLFLEIRRDELLLDLKDSRRVDRSRDDIKLRPLAIARIYGRLVLEDLTKVLFIQFWDPFAFGLKVHRDLDGVGTRNRVVKGCQLLGLV